MLKVLRYIFFPISFLYRGILYLRNLLYDKNIIKSYQFSFPVICVGNLAVGGTGKTPMVEYLVRLLKDNYQTATLSRGYKRKTKGYAIANKNSTALEIGDEPMQFHQKFKDITVAVGEERVVAIPQLLYDRPATEVIILDDAFQHRMVKASLNILLTECNNLYSTDRLLPVGNLRDITSSSKRADIIVVTKCEEGLSLEKKKNIKNQLKPLPHQHIFFSEVLYAPPSHLFTGETISWNKNIEAILICGIANPKPLQQFLHKQIKQFQLLEFSDHHIFTTDDLEKIKKQFDTIIATNKLILTTEKDGVRLQKFKTELESFPIYVLPIVQHFLFEEGPKFDALINENVNKYANPTAAAQSSQK